ncbi:endonuclease/exonuclease/phosphatase family protein [Acidaminobacter sp. JC074]|uniref:endonuclease/exonuclease/phosphatase family protein n=1 Tax=Acidaminobacter sp. JC074 TaxID=2530199 RepID=UPI001F101A17|nr:endonuclease/exonuclease/phosphatase family protein [Acidaminobacter sp. JC074]MCH4891113.1 endonuclease/exonuclease/phosphatase family protein [Acidaminobacter sp. JC074]
MKTLISIVIGIVIVATLSLAGLFVFLTVTDYKPEPVEEVQVVDNKFLVTEKSVPITFLSWNIGFCGSGEEEDLFLDDGTKVRPDNAQVVQDNLKEVVKVLESSQADFIMLQEIDLDSRRSYNIDQKIFIDDALMNYSNSFGKNFDVQFVPFPLPPIGKAKAGLGSYTTYSVNDVSRYTLPGEFDWPKKLAMLDRCMLVSRLPVEGTQAELLVINAHFSAYDDGSIRAQQLTFIKDFVLDEYDKGNYVVLGGDWNQTFPGVDSNNYPLYKGGEYWLPNQIEKDWLAAGWTFGYGDGAPTYRLLNEPYKEGFTQTGIIDGFLVSPNVSLVSSEVLDLNFKYSDHNPVQIVVTLK